MPDIINDVSVPNDKKELKQPLSNKLVKIHPAHSYTYIEWLSKFFGFVKTYYQIHQNFSVKPYNSFYYDFRINSNSKCFRISTKLASTTNLKVKKNRRYQIKEFLCIGKITMIVGRNDLLNLKNLKKSLYSESLKSVDSFSLADENSEKLVETFSKMPHSYSKCKYEIVSTMSYSLEIETTSSFAPISYHRIVSLFVPIVTFSKLLDNLINFTSADICDLNINCFFYSMTKNFDMSNRYQYESLDVKIKLLKLENLAEIINLRKNISDIFVINRDEEIRVSLINIVDFFSLTPTDFKPLNVNHTFIKRNKSSIPQSNRCVTSKVMILKSYSTISYRFNRPQIKFMKNQAKVFDIPWRKINFEAKVEPIYLENLIKPPQIYYGGEILAFDFVTTNITSSFINNYHSVNHANQVKIKINLLNFLLDEIFEINNFVNESIKHNLIKIWLHQKVYLVIFNILLIDNYKDKAKVTVLIRQNSKFLQYFSIINKSKITGFVNSPKYSLLTCPQLHYQITHDNYQKYFDKFTETILNWSVKLITKIIFVKMFLKLKRLSNKKFSKYYGKEQFKKNYFNNWKKLPNTASI